MQDTSALDSTEQLICSAPIGPAPTWPLLVPVTPGAENDLVSIGFSLVLEDHSQEGGEWDMNM